jgi:Trp operon repressor
MGNKSTLEVKLNGRDHIAILVNLLTETVLTDRELGILKVLITAEETIATPNTRRLIKEKLNISRENLNNMLIRMQVKGIFDKHWKVTGAYMPLFGTVDTIIVKLK